MTRYNIMFLRTTVATRQLGLVYFHSATHGPTAHTSIYSLNLGLHQANPFTMSMN